MKDLNHSQQLSNEQINNVVNLYKGGKYQEAINQIKVLNETYPNVPILFNLVGTCYKALGQFEFSVKMFKNAVDLKSDYADAHNNLGSLLKDLGRFDQALNSYDKALEANPNFLEALNNRGIVLNELQLYEDAIKSYQKAISIDSNVAEIFNNLGNTQRMLGQIDDAIKSYKNSISINENFFEGHLNLGETLRQDKQLEESIVMLRKAILVNPKYAKTFNSLGLSFAMLGKMNSAIDCFKKAIEIDSEFAEAHHSLGNALNAIGKFEEAVIFLESAIKINPNFANAYKSLGNVYKKIKQRDKSLEFFEKAMHLKPSLDYLLGDFVNAKMHLCDWNDIDSLITNIMKKADNNEKTIRSFYLLSLVDDPSLQRKVFEVNTIFKYPRSNLLPQIKNHPKHNKIKIGYFSADFREHPVSYLTAELYETHDRNQFEVHAFSYGPDTKDEMNLRIKAGVDHFHDVREMSHKEIATLSRSLEIDIAVDLSGATHSSKTEVFAMLAAPIQTSYIGWLGTMGADYYDYLIAAEGMIPKKNQKYFSEKIVYLPTYQVNDSKESLPKAIFSRKDLGLPEDSFVFCCFNNTFKITPEAFDSWARILNGVEQSVMMIYVSNKHAQKNLIKEIKLRNIDPKRLIFGERLSRAEYLDRYRSADLFLDTFPYNAGTTASDALRMGLPLLTINGNSFNSREAANIVHAVNLPEMITSSQEEYESLAIELANNPKKFRIIKEKLADNLPSAPLFDTPRFTKNLESAYKIMFKRYHDKLEADHIYVEEING